MNTTTSKKHHLTHLTHGLAGIAAALLFLIAIAPRAFAADLYWGGGTGALTDNNWFSDPGLTTPAIRADGDNVKIASGTIFVPVSGTNLSADMGLASGDSSAVIVSGTWTNTSRLSIGDVLGSSASVTILTGGTVAANTFYIGNYGSGYLHIEEGGALSNSANAMFGRNTGGSGTAVIDGSWSAATYIQLGYIADSQGNLLNIGQTGTVSTASYLYIGSAVNTSGTVNVAGVLDIGTNIRVGNSGAGTLEILSGGTVIQRGQNNYVVAATTGADSSGDIIIRSGGYLDAGNRASATNANFGIGWVGQGSLLIETGGTAISAATTATNIAFSIGYQGSGSANIAGTLVAATGYTDIGQTGTGFLTVENGGLVSAARLRLATASGARGDMLIKAGGTVSVTSEIIISASAGGLGSARVEGYLGNGSYLYLGPGTSTLDVASTGTVVIGTNVRIGSAATALASTTVAGLFKVLNGAFDVGHTGAGFLVITESGTLDINGGYFAVGNTAANTSGTAIIKGLLTHSNPNQGFIVGNNAVAGGVALIIEETGRAITTGTIFFGRNNVTAGNTTVATGLVRGLLQGSDALLLGAGNYQRGILDIAATGTVMSARGVLGQGTGAYGSGTVSGLWQITNDLVIGNSSTGVLNIEAGGAVAAGGITTIASAAGSTGTLALNGGVLQTTQLALGAGAATVVVNGGTLRAAADSANFLNMAALDLGASTLNLDTQGFAVTLTNAFTATAGGAIDKRGAGMLVLAGDNSAYTGAINIREGSLGGSAAGTLGGDLTILSGATLDVRAAPLTTAGNVTFADGAIWQYSLTGTHLLDVAGALNFAGGGTVLLDRDGMDIPSIPGAYTLAHYNSVTGAANLSTWSLTGMDFALTGSLTTDASPGSLILEIGTANTDILYWQGGNGAWDDVSTTWKRSGTAVPWNFGALGIFNAGSGAVDITGLQTASGLQFDTAGYILGGTGTLAAGGTMNINLTTASAAATINTALNAVALRKVGAGALTIGGVATIGGPVVVDSGSLAIAATGEVSASEVQISSTTATPATVTVAGLLSNSGTLFIGNSGTGALIVESGGTVNAATGYIGNGAGDFGTANVEGSLTISTSIAVGNSGSGALDIASTGTVVSARATIGQDTGAYGSATVAGFWQNTGTFIIGGAGTGILDIASTGTATTNTYVIGAAAGVTGTVNIAGYLYATTISYVGGLGEGTMIIESTGTLGFGSSFRVGGNGSQNGVATGTGVAIVRGFVAGSVRTIAAGFDGNGRIEVEAGGVVNNRDVYAADYAEASGTINIRSGGAWNSDGNLYVGNYGAGVMNIEQGGVYSSTGNAKFVGVGYRANAYGRSSGTLNVDGYLYASSNTLIIGGDGDGTLDIGATGTVAGGHAILGDGTTATGSGTATVSGLWQANGDLVVGNSGTGHLTLQSGGSVIVAGTTTIGAAATGNGTLVLDGGVLETRQLAQGAGAAAFVFNGGTLRAGAASADFLNMASLDLGAGALMLDTQAFAVTATNAFAGTGAAVLDKTGAGTLKLTADSSAYAGTLNIHSGALAGDAAAKIGGQVNIHSGATLDMRGGPLATGNISLADGAVWKYSIAGQHELGVSGTLVFEGAGTFLLDRDGTPIPHIIGAYTLATYTDISGTANLASWLVTGMDFTLSSTLTATVAPGSLILEIGSADVDFLYWQGGNGAWDNASTTWLRSGSASLWNSGAFAVFNTGSGAVDVSDAQTITGLQFDTAGYILEGAGSLTNSGTVTIHTTAPTADATINVAITAAALHKAGAGSVTLGGPASFTGEALIDGGALAIAATGNLSAAGVQISSTLGDAASVAVAGLLSNTGTLLVGSSGSGALDIEATGTVNSASTIIANDATSIGASTVAGLLNTTGALTVGAAGEGAMDIAATGTAKGASITIGDAADSTGTATVAGLLDTTGALTVGNAGAGNLAIAATGTVNATTASLGSQIDSTGAATVEGLLKSTGALTVGGAGSGTLEIGSTGTVTSGGIGYIGNAAGSGGTVNVAGLLTTTGNLAVGNAGNGALDIAPTGTVQVGGIGYIGNAAGSSGTVNVAGLLAVTSNLAVGMNGTGALTIAPTGTVTNVTAALGWNANATGSAEVAGAWNVSGNLNVGNAAGATGALTIAPTGTVTVGTYVSIGHVADATGTASVAGDLIVTNTLAVGNGAGTGYLDVAETGKVTSANLVFATGSNSVGGATVAGYMEVAGSANQIGIYGVGSLEITETGTVKVTNANNYFLAARYAGSSGTLIVRGFLDTGTRAGGENGNFGIGWDGAAYAEISGTAIASGANDTDVAIAIGHSASSVGTLDLSGLLVATKGRVHNGKAGTGILNIAHTGTLIANGLYSQNASSTLGIEIDPSRTDAYITAASAQVGGTLNLTGAGLDYAPVSKSSELSDAGVLVLTATSGTITGNFATITGMGGAAPDYLLPGGFIITDESTGFADYRAAYRLAWNGPSSAHGTFTIADDETFEVDTPLGDRVGEASPSWDKKSLTKAGAGTLVLSAENTFTGTLAITSGTVRLGGPELHRFGSLANDGVLDFGTPATIPVTPPSIMAAPPSGITYRTVEVGSLSGNGTLQMTVNPGTGESDRLIVLGKATGAHHINLTASSDATAPDGGPAPILTKINGANTATFTGGLDFDGANYAIVPASGGNIILATNGEAGVNDAIRGIPGAQSLMWFASQDNLTRRLGELRTPDNAPAGEFALWARARAEHASLKSGTDMRPFKMDLYGLELGGDKTLPLTASRLVIGAYAGYGRATQDFRPREGTGTADGESIQTGLGLYAAWLHDTGWFANLTLSAARFKNELNSADQSGNKTTGDHRDDALGASLEVGKRIALDRAIGKGWFAEPVAQASIARLERGDYDTTGANTLRVTGKDIAITRLRASVKAGRLWPLAKGMMELSGRLGASHEDSSGGEIQAGSRWRPNVDGTRAEAGVGLIWRPTKEGQLYFDYELATGDSYQKPWSVSLGYRHGF